MNTAFSGVAVGNNIYWPGQVVTQGIGVNKIEIRNLTNGTSTEECANGNWGIATKNDDIIFFGSYPQNQFDIYNTTAGRWSTGKVSPGLNYGAVISVNNTIYVGGGGGGNCGAGFSNKVYTLSW